ncbi:MAG: hypothetical protein M3Y87_27160 [Myxococcota bacterium]|nr:hypothetical protein [Myxococcota bacterium]
MRSRVLSALLLIGLVSSCVGTPQPNPPSLDPSQIGSTRSTQLLGLSGAIDPPGAELWITPLDTLGDPQVIVSNADGSFAAMPLEGELQRMQPRLSLEGSEEVLRGPIVDVRVSPVDGVSFPALALPCWRMPIEQRAPDTAVGSATELVIEITNDCGEPVVVTGAAPRRPSDFTVAETPTEIAAGARGTLRVQFAPSAEGVREEVVFVDLGSPAIERRAVSIYGVGTR